MPRGCLFYSTSIHCFFRLLNISHSTFHVNKARWKTAASLTLDDQAYCCHETVYSTVQLFTVFFGFLTSLTRHYMSIKQEGRALHHRLGTPQPPSPPACTGPPSLLCTISVLSAPPQPLPHCENSSAGRRIQKLYVCVCTLHRPLPAHRPRRHGGAPHEGRGYPSGPQGSLRPHPRVSTATLTQISGTRTIKIAAPHTRLQSGPAAPPGSGRFVFYECSVVRSC